MRIRTRKWRAKSGEVRKYYQIDLGVDPVTKRRVRKQFATRHEAKEWAQKRSVEKEIADASNTVRAAGVGWIEAVKADGRARATWIKYQQHLDKHISPMPVPIEPRGREELPFGRWVVERLDTPAIVRFKKALQDHGRSPAMVQKILATLRMLLGYAERAGFKPGTSGRDVRAKRGERHKRPILIPTPDQVRTLLGLLNQLGAPVTLGRVLINLLPATGLRPEEARALPEHLVSIDERPYFVEVAWAADDRNVVGPPKSRAGYRRCPIPDELAALLRLWRDEKPKSNTRQVGPLMFPTSGGHVYGHSNLYHRVWRPLMHAARLTRPTGKVDPKTKQPKWVPIFTMYALRHFYASMLIAQGHQPKQVQRLMGHSSVKMTLDVYGHLWEDAERDQAIADGVGKFLAR